MTDKYFLDTNILVYAYDKSESDKENGAQKILEDGIRNENAVLSTQVLGEFFNVTTKHINNPFSAVEAEEILRSLSVMQVAEITAIDVFRAIETHKKYQTSYWDSLILSTAEQSGCNIVYSEDFNHEQTYNNIKVINPFI